MVRNIFMIVHGYLGYKASKEMEQFFTEGELRRIAHYEDGVWIAPTRSTLKSYLPDVFPYFVSNTSICTGYPVLNDLISPCRHD